MMRGKPQPSREASVAAMSDNALTLTSGNGLTFTPVAQGGNLSTRTDAAPPEYTAQQKQLIKDACMAKHATDTEFALFLEVANRLGLDPLVKQIYAIHRKSGDKYQMTIQTGIDGYTAIASRTDAFAGVDDVIYDTEEAEHPNKATVTVYRFVQGQRMPFTASARWLEYRQITRDYRTGEIKLTGKWADMPYGMLGKCALAKALRLAFPAQLAGIYTDVEMDQADNPAAPASSSATVVVTAAEVPVVNDPAAEPDGDPPWLTLRADMRALDIKTVADANEVCKVAGVRPWQQLGTWDEYHRLSKLVANMVAQEAARHEEQ